MALLGAFVVVEARAVAPLMPLRLFGIRSVSAANAAMFLCGAALVSSWYFLSLYLQNVLRLTPLQAGLAFIPLSVVSAAGAMLAPALMQRLGGRSAAIAGVLTAAAGYLLLGGLDADGSSLAALLVPAILVMLGIGLLATPLAAIATAGPSTRDAGVASGLVNTSRTMGGSLGLAVLVALAASRSAGDDAPAAHALAFQVGAATLLACALLMRATLPGRQTSMTTGRIIGRRRRRS